MDRGLLVFAVLFLALPLIVLAMIPWLGAGAAITLASVAMVLLLLGFTVGMPFVDVE